MWIRAASVLLIVLAGCSRDVVPPLRPVDDTRVTVLEPSDPDAVMRRWLDSLREQWPAAAWAAWGAWEPALDLALDAGHVVLVPDSARVPLESLSWFETYLAAGGKALFLGASPFSDVEVRYEAERMLWSSYLERLMQRAEEIPDFSVVQLWRHEQSGGERRSIVRAASGAPWPGVQVEPYALYEWDHMALPEFVTALGEADYGALAFYARGSRYTSRLVLRALDVDGREWLRPVSVGPNWEPQMIFGRDWFVGGAGSQSSGAPSELDWTRVQDLTVGLNMQQVPQSAGRHEYSVSDLRLVPRRAVLPPLPRLRMPWIQDPDWLAGMEAFELRGVRTEVRWRVRGQPVGISWQDPSIRTPDDAARWLPLFVATDRSGDGPGTVGGVFLRHADGESLEQWAWIGVDLTRRTQSAVSGMVHESLFVLQKGRLLLQAELPYRIFDPGEVLEISAQVVGLEVDPLTVRVSAEWVDDEDQIIRRVVSTPFELSGGHIEQDVSLHLGVVPRVEEGVRSFVIEVGLEEVGGRSRRFDRMRLPVKVVGLRKEPQVDERLRALAGRLVAGRIPMFIVGADYDPGVRRYPDRSWLEARQFPVEKIHRDFAGMRAAGMNAVSIPYAHPSEARQIRYVIEVARQHSLRVNVLLPNWWNWSLEDEGLRPYLDAIGFAEDIHVFSLDLTPPQMMPAAEMTARLDAAWTRWLQVQAGGVERASELWSDLQFDGAMARFPLPDDAGTLSDDSPLWVLMHRFLADWWSGELGRAARQIRNAGYRTLLTARWNPAAWDGAHPIARGIPFPAEAGVIHLDYLTVTPEVLVGGEQNLVGEAFRAAYGRGLVYGKPVVWGPLRAPVGETPGDTDLALQEATVAAFYRLAMGTQTSGGWLGQYRPIAAVRWDGDEGVVDVTGRRRPSVRALRQVINQLRGYRMRPLQWAGREMEMQGGVDPWAAAQADWGQVYVKELAERRVAEIRPRGYMDWSIDASTDRLAGLPHAPFVQMHAEWGALRVAGQEVDVSVDSGLRMEVRQSLQAEWINRGPARWSASQHRQEGTVWMSVKREGRPPQFLEVRAVPPGGSVMIEWVPVDPGTYTFRGHWLDRGGFGDTLVVEVN